MSMTLASLLGRKKLLFLKFLLMKNLNYQSLISKIFTGPIHASVSGYMHFLDTLLSPKKCSSLKLNAFVAYNCNYELLSNSVVIVFLRSQADPFCSC